MRCESSVCSLLLVIIASTALFVACGSPLAESNDITDFVEKGMSVSLSYDPNTGSGTVPTTTHYAYGISVVLFSGNTLSRNGYRLTGWNTKADGTGSNFGLGATISINQRPEMTLYAVWTMGCSITYDGNGNLAGTVPADSKAYWAGENVSVMKNTGALTRVDGTGYVFAGWNTAADGSGTGYAAGSTLTMGSENLTLYARWTRLSGIQGEFFLNGSSAGVTVNDATLTSDQNGNADAAYAFTASTASSTISSPLLRFPSTNAFSISVWCMPSAATFTAGTGSIWSMPGNANECQYSMYVSGNHLAVRVGENYVWGNGSQLHFPVSADTWHNIVIVYNGVDTLTEYLDGAYANSTAIGMTPKPAPNTTFRVGGSGFIGSIGSLRVYNRALTASEIATLFLE